MEYALIINNSYLYGHKILIKMKNNFVKRRKRDHKKNECIIVFTRTSLHKK